MTLSLDLDGVLAAPALIDPVFLHTPLRADAALDAALGCRLLAKDETDNPIGSFKGRGTELFVATVLRPGEAIVSASAGNFGQGLARAATRRGHACTVFAAETANPAKLEAMRALGADVRLAGADFDAAKLAARQYAQAHQLRFVEDGAEPAIAQGAGTIALELLAYAMPDVMLVPLGNGALLEGIGSVLRARAPSVETVAVVAAGAPSMKLSLEAQCAVETERADTIADGIAVRVPIASRLPQLRRCCDRVVAVSEAQLIDAMRLLHRHLGMVVEPAGAAGVAAILAEPGRYAGRLVVTVLCGKNIHPSLRDQLVTVKS
jgi:threonine dehydratase